MATDTSVKFFTSADQGAPTLNGTAGSLIAVLDACLVNGYNLMAAQSLSVANGIATLSFASNHGYQIDQVIVVSGATPAALNGEQKVVSVTSTSLTFATAVADGAATGGITAKYASAGWAKAFTGTNLAAYKSNDPKSTGMYLRVDDTGANNARVVGCETMVDINTVTNKFPTESMASGGWYWAKSNASSNAARPWRLYADARVMYLHVNTSASTQESYWACCGFGDIIPFNKTEAYYCFCHGFENANFPAAYGYCEYANLLWSASANGSTVGYQRGFAFARPYHGISTALMGGTLLLGGYGAMNSGDSSGSASAFKVFPNPADNALIVMPTWVVDTSPTARGMMPGMYKTPQPVGTALGGNGTRVSGLDALPGRTLHTLISSVASNTGYSCTLIDVTGPWR